MLIILSKKKELVMEFLQLYQNIKACNLVVTLELGL